MSLADTREAVLGIYRERKNLALTLHDTHTVVAKLELIFGSVLHVLAGFLYLVIFQVCARGHSPDCMLECRSRGDVCSQRWRRMVEGHSRGRGRWLRRAMLHAGLVSILPH